MLVTVEDGRIGKRWSWFRLRERNRKGVGYSRRGEKRKGLELLEVEGEEGEGWSCLRLREGRVKGQAGLG